MNNTQLDDYLTRLENYFTEETLNVCVSIWGYNEETFDGLLYYATTLNSYEQLLIESGEMPVSDDDELDELDELDEIEVDWKEVA